MADGPSADTLLLIRRAQDGNFAQLPPFGTAQPQAGLPIHTRLSSVENDSELPAAPCTQGTCAWPMRWPRPLRKRPWVVTFTCHGALRRLPLFS